MSNQKSRIAKLETAAGIDTAKSYVCIYYIGQEAEGFDVTPSQFVTMADRKANTLHFETLAELQAFEARPDVDLTIVEISYASETQPVSTLTNRDYSVTVGVDLDKI